MEMVYCHSCCSNCTWEICGTPKDQLGLFSLGLPSKPSVAQWEWCCKIRRGKRKPKYNAHVLTPKSKLQSSMQILLKEYKNADLTLSTGNTNTITTCRKRLNMDVLIWWVKLPTMSCSKLHKNQFYPLAGWLQTKNQSHINT